MQDVTWEVPGGSSESSVNVPEGAKKLPYVSTWGNFSKLPDDEKGKIYNAMRGALIAYGLMENGK